MAIEVLDPIERNNRLFVEICPFRIGSRVRVRQCDSMPAWASDWANGVFIVTGLRWEYQKGAGDRLNISIASEDEIVNRLGDTDGFRVDHLEPEISE